MSERSKKFNVSLESNLSERYEIRDPFEKILEEIVNENNHLLRNTIDKILEKYIISYSDNHKNQRSKANVIYVSPHELPSGIGWIALGMYNPNTHTIYIANNLSSDIKKFVYYHEEAHSLGIRSERSADDYAAAKVGYNLRRGFDYTMAA